MSYIINKTSGSKLVTIEDGSINVTTCDLSLVGKNYAGYGEAIATNFVKLLENFASTKQPARPLTGQIWYDSTNKKIKFYNGVEFKGIPVLQSSDAAPTDLLKGDLWYNETEGKLYYYNGSGYIMIGPQITGKAALNTTLPVLVSGNKPGGSDAVEYILQHQVQSVYDDESDVTKIAIISNQEFTPTSGSYSSDGFSLIKRGITFPGTSDDGISSATADTQSSYILWGTASHALRLGEYAASDYITKDNPIFSTQVQVNNQTGINIATGALRFNTTVNGAEFSTKTTRMKFSLQAGPTLYELVNFSTNANASGDFAILPSSTDGVLVNIGDADSPFYNVYGTNFYGLYNAPAADLAENYLADATYEPGTVLKIGGAKEVTICDSYECEQVAGVVTTAPAYLMNHNLEGEYVAAIALKGRIPCKVKGPIKKGDILVPSNISGHAEVRRYGNRSNLMAVIGKALQDFSGEYGVIEIMI
jgi:hypothetical protein